ncbi:protein of unknown function - conserved [Leishmania donovani]|uniref:Uncharacterized protein n=3 Tax=Leishmania donovani species complex TaxID=38574 RepID=A4HXA1_LEIIN|nr:conserved hypothetical protein [Leishmania infantum JPCM5]XP_003859893.1 hypothetical protein, conserved [Leishmania donovani]CAC9477537.1 hypothetical_protein_-_conserved [Leishmania infantum]AYU77798.1 hypothetical protein LdCL_170009400 [Leishmania donovani]TPP51672.1 hypothetical protein CGC21_3855 [Leishmania donovani]CAJ1987819.1 protein of unknown function - conserved [Leishmania donovani]CAM59720.1 conserved hypothetical protein [Leishmania infantum JPCM5]|eukprot:XP_001464692.1 conserved hypothetical protein [Leishmania infantum JPCM5]
MPRTIKCILCAVALVAAFAAALAITMTVRERVPNGLYCGNYASGLVVGNLTVTYATHLFDLALRGLGMNLKCKNEVFTYDPKSHMLTAVSAKDPSDCIGSVIAASGLNLSVIYKPTADLITLDFGIAKIDCKKCSA